MISLFIVTIFCPALVKMDLTLLIPTYITPTTKGYCVYQGEIYPPGGFKPSPCVKCVCSANGQSYCLFGDCNPSIYYFCKDLYREHPDDCCPKCAYGYNCTAPDGSFMQYGKKYHVDQNLVCHCLGREPNETAVCNPVHPTKIVPEVVGYY
ncbi:brorin-like [Saccostrea cucullata]|uniref:brorin-like n=1 Tax=Saccostrea cuccullata TaxID=36930 RepID=UPI002ED4C195